MKNNVMTMIEEMSSIEKLEMFKLLNLERPNLKEQEKQLLEVEIEKEEKELDELQKGRVLVIRNSLKTKKQRLINLKKGITLDGVRENKKGKKGKTISEK